MATVACAMRARERGDGLRADGMWDARLGGRIAVILVGGSEARAGKSPTAEHRKVDLHTHEHLYLCTQGCTQYYSPPTSICALRSLGLTVPAVSVCLLCANLTRPGTRLFEASLAVVIVPEAISIDVGDTLTIWVDGSHHKQH